MRQPYEYSQQGYQVYDGWAIIVEAIGSADAPLVIDWTYHPDPGDSQPVPPAGTAPFIEYAADLAIHTHTIPVNRGTVSAVTVRTTSTTLVRGQIFVRIKIGYAITATPFIVAILAADYVTTFTPVQFPGTGIYQSTQGTGALGIQVAAVAPGNPVNVILPANTRRRINAVNATIGALAGNEQVMLSVLYFGGGGQIFLEQSPILVAGTAPELAWQIGVNNPITQTVNAQPYFIMGLPHDLIINSVTPGFFRLETLSGNPITMQLRILYEEWIEI